ncbi:hypothetical protein [Niabella drilacis]|uniref:Uncharacterized protein n=1 Tax=Niabella drilacis (strain DSM 25811 / CCM 8410 / CCUG 62505 / LMG 26954 / E90) TaxID=1285928 RepID=A0A1G7AAA3_NIADE|nr:hypothetical protein [Niabella drilacis]SDE11711.1 hypothetical protein SAMN04487894_12219 [Niabella drilacis]
MKKSNTNSKGHNPPGMEWQTGHYERFAQYHFILPYQFLLLCRLVEVPPERVLQDFMENLGCEGADCEQRDMVQACLIDYFIAHGYGRQHYTPEQIRKVFKGMDAINGLFPEEDEAMIHNHVLWRDQYHQYWFNRWFLKLRGTAHKSVSPPFLSIVKAGPPADPAGTAPDEMPTATTI